MASIPEMLCEPTHTCCSSAVVLISSSGGACEDARFPAVPPLADEPAPSSRHGGMTSDNGGVTCEWDEPPRLGGGACEDARPPPLPLDDAPASPPRFPKAGLSSAGLSSRRDFGNDITKLN